MFESDVDVAGMSSCDLIYTALNNEAEASYNYRTVAHILEDEDSATAAKMFYEMSDVEQGHCNKLLKKLETCGGKRTINLRNPVWQTPETLMGSCFGDDGVVIKPGMTADEAVHAIEKVEKDSEEFYLSAAKQVDRDDLKQFFTELASEEARHLKLIKKIVHHSLER